MSLPSLPQFYSNVLNLNQLIVILTFDFMYVAIFRWLVSYLFGYYVMLALDSRLISYPTASFPAKYRLLWLLPLTFHLSSLSQVLGLLSHVSRCMSFHLVLHILYFSSQIAHLKFSTFPFFIRQQIA